MLIYFWRNQNDFFNSLNILLLLNFVSIVKCDVFTAMVELENLLISEAGTTSAIIDEYIRKENERLQNLREFAFKYDKNNHETKTKNFDVVTNPVNAYLLIKRLNSDWTNIKQMMYSNVAESFIKNITEGRIANAVKYPDEDDLDGAAVGLLRLQDTYRLKTSDLANGFIQGENVGGGFNAQDCFEVGRAAYNNRDYYHTLEWMQEALERIKTEQPPTKKESDILEYYAFSMFQQGNPKRALALTIRLAQLDPTHPRAKEKLNEKDKTNLDDLPPIRNERDTKNDILERDSYEKLCRGEYTFDPVMNSKIYCYLKRDRPFLKLAPIKVEIVRYKPLVVLFRDVISDKEIAVVKRLATPKLRRATVQNAKTGELEFASYRISKSAWLKDHDDLVINRINKRIDTMTNLNQETSEELQVANYGIGGHYDPHFDFALVANYGIGGHYEPHYDMSLRGEMNPYKGFTGNRIATVLFYMSQPKKGGATVYTELAHGVSPTIHDALFWYNLMRSGEGDLRTRHAACPVLSGVKWVSNKWIHERGQEFRRPCGLTPDVEENFVGDLSPK